MLLVVSKRRDKITNQCFVIPSPGSSVDPCLAPYLQCILGPLSLQSGSWDKSTWINFGPLRCLMAIAIEGLVPSWGCWLSGLDNGRPASHINASILSLSTTQFGNTFEHLQVKREFLFYFLEDLFDLSVGGTDGLGHHDNGGFNEGIWYCRRDKTNCFFKMIDQKIEMDRF